MMREKSSYSFLRSLVKGQGHSFFKDLTGVFCTVGGTLVFFVFFFIDVPKLQYTNFLKLESIMLFIPFLCQYVKDVLEI
jgi:hypothetical protein